MPKLKLTGVSKAYGATQALRRGDLEIDSGEVHVLIGSNGSGKSTLCKIVAGSVRPDGGEVLLTSCGQGPGSPQPFYERLGFVPTGEVDSHGEVHLALDLHGEAAP